MVDTRKASGEPVRQADERARPVFTVVTPEMSREQMAANIVAALLKCGITVKTN